MNDVTVYDLGSIDATAAESDRAERATAVTADPGARPAAVPPAASRTAVRPRVAGPRPAAPPRPAVDLPATVNLFVPGTERILRGVPATGLAIVATLGLAAALGWAIVETLGRLTATLELFGISRGAALWALGGTLGLAAATHVAAVLLAEPIEARAPLPVAAGLASALVPGWGQILNGDRGRAAAFLATVWATGALWLLASPAAGRIVEAYDLYLPTWMAVATSPGVRITAVAVVWAIAVYDAAQRASFRRNIEY